MKRSALKRRSPLRAHAPLRRRTRINPVNRKRKAVRFERAYLSTAYVGFIHWTGCVVGRGCSGPVHAAHRISRGAGGTWRELFGACERHHEQGHRIGLQSFQRLHGLNLEAICARNVTEWAIWSRGIRADGLAGSGS
jgi:hypothetical protein